MAEGRYDFGFAVGTGLGGGAEVNGVIGGKSDVGDGKNSDEERNTWW